MSLVPKDDKGGAVDVFRGGGGLPPITLPRIVVLQQLSTEVTRAEDKFPSGILFNRLTKAPVAELEDKDDPKWGKTLTFIPLFHFPVRIRIEQGAGLVCRSRDLEKSDFPGGETYSGEVTQICAECKLKDWPRERKQHGEKLKESDMHKGPSCNVVENFPALWAAPGVDPEDYEVVLLAFSRTSAKAAQDLRGNWTMSGKDYWYFKYQVNVREGRGGPKGDALYFKQEVSRVGKTSPEEQKRAQDIITRLKGAQIEVEGAPEDEEDSAGGAAKPKTDVSGERAF